MEMYKHQKFLQRKQTAELTDNHRMGENLSQIGFRQRADTQNLQIIAEIKYQAAETAIQQTTGNWTE